MARWLLMTVLVSGAALAEDLAEADKPAPAFRLPVYNPDAFGEKTVAIGSYAGPDRSDKDTRAVLVSFMASFCAPCQKEMPFLQALYTKHRKDGLRVLLVAIDTEAEGQKKIEALVAQHQVTFPVAKDRFNLVARRWLGARSPLPSLFVVQPDGKISAVHRGYSADGAELLQKEVEAALGLKK